MDIIRKRLQAQVEPKRKPVTFLGSSLQDIRDFPETSRMDCGYQLDKVQRGEEADSFKPMANVGKGVEEIRIKNADGTYRVIYAARFEEAVYVLHAFRKKTDTTPQKDMDLARARFREMMELHAAFASFRKENAK